MESRKYIDYKSLVFDIVLNHTSYEKEADCVIFATQEEILSILKEFFDETDLHLDDIIVDIKSKYWGLVVFDNGKRLGGVLFTDFFDVFGQLDYYNVLFSKEIAAKYSVLVELYPQLLMCEIEAFDVLNK